MEGESLNRWQSKSFSSKLSTYVTLLGYTIGMSDIWRFPFLVYRNGGGAFFIPFLLTMFLCGIPLFFLEYTISNFSGKGPYRVWDMCPLFRGVGYTLAVAYMTYMAGTSIFRGWLAVFLVNSFQEPLPWTHCNNDWNTAACRPNHFVNQSVNSKVNRTENATSANTTISYNSSTKFMTAAEEFWQYESLGLSTGLTDLVEVRWQLVLFVAILRLVVFVCVFRSIASIEKVMYILLFVPLLFMLSVLIQSLTLPGALDGLYTFFYPDYSKLTNTRIWIEAFLMVFYSLAFGWGGLLTLGSHANFGDNALRTSILLPLFDALFGVLNGAVCFSVLGNMAYTHGVRVEEVLTTGFAAGVVSYVTSLSALPFPHIWNFCFFVAAIMAGLDSQLIPVEMCVQIIGEAYPQFYPKYRGHILGAVSIVLFVMALPTCTRAGGYMFLWCDWYIGVWTGPICAFIEVITVAWIYGMDRFDEDIKLMLGRKLPCFLRITVAIVSPLLVAVIFVTSCLEYVPPRYGDYNYPQWARVVGWVAVLGILSPIVMKACLDLSRQKGPITKRLKPSIRDLPSWGPKAEKFKESYTRLRNVHVKTSPQGLLRYVMVGSLGNSSIEATKQELSSLALE